VAGIRKLPLKRLRLDLCYPTATKRDRSRCWAAERYLDYPVVADERAAPVVGARDALAALLLFERASKGRAISRSDDLAQLSARHELHKHQPRRSVVRHMAPTNYRLRRRSATSPVRARPRSARVEGSGKDGLSAMR